MKKAIVLSGKDNKTVKGAARLISSVSARREEGLFILEGARLCLDAVNADIKIKKAFFTEKATESYFEYAEKISERAEECYTLTPELFAKISDTVSPQGIAAVCELPKSREASVDKKGMYIALENMQDPSNLGAIARTAEALGISGLIIGKGGADPYSPKAQRAAMGSLLRLPIIIAEDFLEYIEEIKNGGMNIVATVVKDADGILGEYEIPQGSVIMIGNEGNGLSSEAIAIADKKITVKMAGRNESLNASAAATLFMWEMMKGR